MASQWVNARDSKFLLHEVLKIDQELLGKAPFSDIDPEMVDMVVEGAATFAEGQLSPHYSDETHGKPVEAVFKNGKVYVPEAYKELWKLFAEGGWLTISDSPEVGGQGLPTVVGAACNEFFYGCNQAFALTPSLTAGAARLVQKFGSDELKAMFLKKMFEGTWAGTMCLTEPIAGSDVGALKAVAKRNPDGSYSVTGTKCFITGGDHDLTEKHRPHCPGED